MKRPKCVVCNRKMYSLYVWEAGYWANKVGYYCKNCDEVYREVFIKLKKINLRKKKEGQKLRK